jgi:hypothetical protein
MKKSILIPLVLAATFCVGFAFKSIITKNKNSTMKKVTGVGGIFFKCKDPKKMTAWYKENLGLETNAWGGATFDNGSRFRKRAKTLNLPQKII